MRIRKTISGSLEPVKIFPILWNIVGKKAQKCVRRKSNYLANILSFVIQNLTQHIHRTPWTFKNGSRLSIDSRSLQLVLPAYRYIKCPPNKNRGHSIGLFYLTLSDISAEIISFIINRLGHFWPEHVLNITFLFYSVSLSQQMSTLDEHTDNISEAVYLPKQMIHCHLRIVKKGNHTLILAIDCS